MSGSQFYLADPGMAPEEVYPLVTGLPASHSWYWDVTLDYDGTLYLSVMDPLPVEGEWPYSSRESSSP